MEAVKGKDFKLKVILLTLAVFLFQQFASRMGVNIANLLDYSYIDKDNTYAWISVHHMIQMILAILLIAIIYRKSKLSFYLKPRFNKVGIKYVLIFGLVYFVYVVVYNLIVYSFDVANPYQFELNSSNILGTLGFQLMLSGPSEEILFRALPITVIGSIWKEEDRKNVFLVIIAAIMFTIAHINWSLNPFMISFSWPQLATAFILGVLEGILYVKTKSIIYAMLCHSLSNVIVVGVGYIFYYRF